jgi:hypothetical protein
MHGVWSSYLFIFFKLVNFTAISPDPSKGTQYIFDFEYFSIKKLKENESFWDQKERATTEMRLALPKEPQRGLKPGISKSRDKLTKQIIIKVNK